MTRLLVSLVAALLVFGCGSSSNDEADGGDDGGGFSANPPLSIGGDRPAKVYIPENYDPDQSYPLLILLHGFGSNADQQNFYFGLSDFVDEQQYVLVTPNGTLNSEGDRFWNATEACCDFEETGVDDVAYLRGLIAEAKEIYNVDHDRVYTMGHSNGGFMSFRMACEASDVITAIAPLAGGTFDDPADCQPATLPVSVLAMHGTADATIAFEGVEDAYPSAEEAVERWAGRAGCDTESPTTPPNLDLIAAAPGAETVVTRYETGCTGGVETELWAIEGAPHIPFTFQPNFTPMVLDWLFDHSR